MKKLLLIYGLLIPLFVSAQTGGNTGGGNTDIGGNSGNGGNSQPQPGNNSPQQNNQTNPYFQNPYSNPYNQNPYLDPAQQNQNFFNNQDQNRNQPQNGQQPNDLQREKEKNGTDANQDPNKFQDLNNPKSPTPEDLMREMYKNDPEYLNYLKSQEKKTSAEKLENDEAEKDVKVGQKLIYGANFFSNNVFDLSDKTPTIPPNDYRLSPGDEIIVSLWGNAELQQPYTIGKDGSIFPRLVGKIYLQGMTFDAASQLIENRFKKIVPQNTNIDVQMGRARTIRVTILGEVSKQGTYTISAFNTALNALYRAGGLSPIGNLRRIEIKREGRTVDVIDLYKYLQKEKNAQEVYLEDNDYIYVDVFEKIVNAEGMFKRPMYYQLTGDEGLTELMEFAGGPTSNARNSLIHIKTIANETEKYIDIPGTEFFNSYKNDYNIVLNDGDVVTLKPINPGLKNVVKVSGAVNYPDEYQVKPGEHLSKILERAGGIASTAYLPRAFVYRGAVSLENDVIKLDLRDLSNNPDQDIEILSGDRIVVLSAKSFDEEYTIDVIGSVRKPGKITFMKNMKLKDVLLLSGGLTLDAENGRIEVSNMVDSVDRYNLKSRKKNLKIISINSNLEIDEISENILIKPLDRIYVRRKTEFVTTEKVQISGEVNYPGEYVLLEKNERISSVIERSGGLRKFAYADGTRLFRQNVGPVVIDLPLILKEKDPRYDLILKDGDMLIVPTVNDIVSVRGEVQNPVNLKYNKGSNNLDYYIAAAGGFGEKPWKKRISVRYQSGRIRATKSFLFVRIYPKIKEGSTVFVPQKPKKEKSTTFGEVFQYTVTAITTLATIIILSNTLK